ncbi:MAG: ABC transporter permease [Coriobacteriia bacterium]|nr:ABC transporter permease [Coriobacteriia bacterium]
MLVRLALRNLFQSPPRLLIGVGGIGLAALLILTIEGIYAGATRQATTYMDNTGFDLVVSQEGVRSFHMSSSQFPAAYVELIRATEGVAEADPILYETTFLIADDERSIAYLIGYRRGDNGGPWARAEGDEHPAPGEILIDEQLARDVGVGIGDEVTAAGTTFRIGGLSRGAVTVLNSIAFVRFADLEQARGLQDRVSFVLVDLESGADAEEVADALRRQLDGVTVQTRSRFAAEERQVVADVSIDLMRMMVSVALLIGLAVTGLTAYTATLSKLPEYGLLKAVGAPSRSLFGTVLAQTAIAAALGAGLGLAGAAVVQYALRETASGIPMALEAGTVARVLAAAAGVALAAAVVPIARVAAIDPAEVFRR